MLTGIVRQMFAKVLVLGKIVLNNSSVLGLVSCQHKVLLAAWIGSYEMFSTLFKVQGISVLPLYIHHPAQSPHAALHCSARLVDPLNPLRRIASLKSLQLALSSDQRC